MMRAVPRTTAAAAKRRPAAAPDSRDPADSGTRREQAYRRILALVLGGSLGEHEFLSEQRLAEQFGMSRAPVREALQTLSTEGLLHTVPRAGYRVAPLSLGETLDALEVRLLLETETVSRACRLRDAPTLARLDALIADERANAARPMPSLAATDELQAWFRAGDAVHLALAAMSRNVVLEREVARMLDLLRRPTLQVMLRAGGLREIGHYHREILQAVRRGDEAQAVAALRKDVLILRELIAR